METVICPKCSQTNSGETTLYHCQYCGQSLSGVPRRLATQPTTPDAPSITMTGGASLSDAAKQATAQIEQFAEEGNTNGLIELLANPDLKRVPEMQRSIIVDALVKLNG